MRLEFSELKRMNSQWKKDYFDEILKYDKRIEKYMENELAKALKEHIENLKGNQELGNIKAMWTHAKHEFN